MRQRYFRYAITQGLLGAALIACTVPNPTYRQPGGDAGPDDTSDGSIDAPPGGGGGGNSSCTPNQALRCDGNNLVRCSASGTGEVSSACSLGCSSSELRCLDVYPSNGLAAFLDMTSSQSDVNLGISATINTDNGVVTAEGAQVAVTSASVAQSGAPTIRVFVVRSLTANDVVVTGSNALAIVSNGDIKVSGVFTASAKRETPGAGRFNDGNCKGADEPPHVGYVYVGAGGGGFGSAGGSSGSAKNSETYKNAAPGGAVTGNLALVPLRGGCDSGRLYLGNLNNATAVGAGGGAIQFVSRTKIVVSGVAAANGGSLAGGGSGGGILLEAPTVDVPGRVVANGGAGASGCPSNGEDGKLDATPAAGGLGCTRTGFTASNGGNGGSRNSEATNGADAYNFTQAVAGHGGGGVGRIRVNTAPGGHRATGQYSPVPSEGNLAVR